MSVLKHSLCLALVGSGLAVVAAASTANASTAGSVDDPTGSLRELRANADGSVRATPEPATGKVGFVRAGRDGDLLPGGFAAPAEKADAFLDDYAGLFGAERSQLQQQSVQKDEYGHTVTYEQVYRGVPVFGGELKAHLDTDGDLTSVNGVAVPDIDISVEPRFDRAESRWRAVREVRLEPPAGDGQKADTSGLKAVSADLFVYQLGLVRGKPGAVDLVWRVEVTNRVNVRDIVFMSATTGKPVNRYSMIHDALERKIYEQTHDPSALVWQEGDSFPGDLNEDQQNIVDGSGESYWFFHNVFGRDSYDGQGHVMETVNNDPRINCPNANWNGTTTNYCNGVTSDDVVAHEWGHAYTDHTHGLIYQWQPGALNESYSDIWGETIDLINGRMDDDDGDTTTPRDVGACHEHSPQVTINSPDSIAGDCATGYAMFGPELDEAGITGNVVLGTDAVESEDGSTATDGCSPLDNAAEVEGNIALIDRGVCNYTVKAKQAQDAGAIALIVGSTTTGVANMAGGGGVTIPTVMIPQPNRNEIVAALDASEPVEVTIRDTAPNSEGRQRWLIAEDSWAFGGEIRDMWTPTCAGAPGKVSDGQYWCSASDFGGVHTNSGVPNHGYALLVDGGTYNGVDVSGIGLTKAAHIYFRAMTNYQSVTSGFVDHADALEASCTDLIGQPLNELSTQPADRAVSSEVIAADDCAAVTAMAQAVELRREPVQCDFQPALDPDAPPLCDDPDHRTDVYSEDFENGLGAWTTGYRDAPDPAGQLTWEIASELPEERAGAAAYAPNPIAGNCGGEGDMSGVSTLTSDVISIPDGGTASRLAFDHYFATEAGYDGGNLKISVNGGQFLPVAGSAMTFNAHSTWLVTAGRGNTNPNAGQAAFTGTDGGSFTGSWGQTQVDLAKLHIVGGDQVQVRFDFGRDGCNGNDGWYVDNVVLSVCMAQTNVDVTMPRFGRFGTPTPVPVQVTDAGDDQPTGTVEVRGDGIRLGQAELIDGAATVTLPGDLARGRHQLTVRYLGDDRHLPSSSRERLIVMGGGG